MQYRNDRKGEPISMLGFGCMRFQRKGSGIDYDKAEAQILRAKELGVNYFDTAYLYPGSEEVLGRVLASNNCREEVRIATKLPQYLVRKASGLDRFFNEELRRLQTDYVDYYLMHMVTDVQQWENLRALGVEDWIARKKESGAIRNIGFSFHGSTELFLQVLNAYDWDFCQIQYNYLDEHTQAGRRGLMAAAEKGIPVVIMEPLRGGKLVDSLPEAARAAFASSRHSWSPAEWALRWLWNQPQVTCVLSGMNSLEMVEENCRVASEVKAGALTDDDFETLEQVKQAILSTTKVGCTGCGYCMPCPQGVDIPALFRCYNHMYTESKNDGRQEYWQTVSLREVKAFARQCVGCGACERKCPQGISIREQIRIADRELRPLPWRIAGDVARHWAVRKRD
ncbi:MAG: aldo/keto reductase [Coriobacteriales bacterium]|nr:aldo/keto reductase [Coriobacteriales bacterium]